MCIASASAVVRSGCAVFTASFATRLVRERTAARIATRVASGSSAIPGFAGITLTPSE